MAKRRTEKSCYESKYGGGWITAAQWLAEKACEREEGRETLGTEFWKLKPWDAVYRREATHANTLLRRFAVQAITNAWESPGGRRVRTLGAPFFVAMVEKEDRRLKTQTDSLNKIQLPPATNTLETPRPVKRSGKSILEKLRDATKQNDKK